jgi:segregation and condensation protein B
MSEFAVIPELRTIVGALIFGANRPLKVSEMRRCVVEVAEEQKGELAPFVEITEGDVRTALDEMGRELERTKPGFVLREVAGGFRFESEPSCGVWLRHLLDVGKPNRLSRPALETLAIIAYRQPGTKISIEGIRGVQVDHIMKMLMEMQLVRIVGRSDLPGRPFLYGTTQMFLEHFGLRNLDDLSDLEPMLAKEMQAADRAAEAGAEPVTVSGDADADAAPAEPEPAPAGSPEVGPAAEPPKEVS